MSGIFFNVLEKKEEKKKRRDVSAAKYWSLLNPGDRSLFPTL